MLSPAEVASVAEVPAGDARLLLRRDLLQPLFVLGAAAAGPQADDRQRREEMEYATLSELTDLSFAIRGERISRSATCAATKRVPDGSPSWKAGTTPTRPGSSKPRWPRPRSLAACNPQ